MKAYVGCVHLLGMAVFSVAVVGLVPLPVIVWTVPVDTVVRFFIYTNYL